MSPSATASSRRHHPANYVSAALRILIAAAGYLVVFGAVGAGGWVALLTFTVQSNLMVAISFTWTAWALITDRRTPPEWLAASSVFYISITGLIFYTLVSPGSFRTGSTILWGFTPSDFAHALMPLAVLLVWVVFEEHQRIPWRYALIWMIYLVVYIVAIGLLAVVVDDVLVPYRFLDPSLQGWGEVLGTIVTLLFVFAGLAVALIGLDRLLPPRTTLSEYDRFDQYYADPLDLTRRLCFSGGGLEPELGGTSIP